MRKSYFLAGLAAIAAIGFNACTKSEVDVQTPEVLTHTVTINATYAPETRTSIVEGDESASFIWSSNDNERFVVKENDVVGTEVALSLSDGNKKAKLSATFATVTADTYVYSAFLAGHVYSGLPGITNQQTMNGSSFDPDADILIAKPLTFNSPQKELSMQFARPVVINKMTLKGLTVGETVETVEISGDVKITGNYQSTDNSWVPYSEKITVTVNQSVPTGGELPIYFITMPVNDVTLTVKVNTSANIYSKTFAKTINFLEGQVTVFGVSGLTVEKKPTTFTVGQNTEEKIYEIASIFPSVKNGIKFSYDKGGSQTDPAFYSPFRWYKNSTVTLSAGQTPINKIALSFSGSNTGTITADKGTYDTETHIWTPSDNATTQVTFTNTGDRAEFKAIDVYTDENGTETVVESTPTLDMVTSVQIPKDATKSLVASSNFNNATISYASNDETVATVDETGVVTGIKTGTAIISASITAVSTDYYVIKTVSKQCEVTVTAPATYDILNYLWTNISGSGYKTWSGIEGSYSDAIYAGNSNAGDDVSYIQIRKQNPSGIVSSTSGGKVQKVAVIWSSAKTNGDNRKLNIYGSNRPYSGSASLYDESFPQTLLGTIIFGTDNPTELEIEGSYEYVGLASDGAAYFDEIDIWWDDLGDRVAKPTNVAASVSGTSINVTWQDVTTGVAGYIVTCTGQTPITIEQGVEEATFNNLDNGTYSITIQSVPSASSDAYSELCEVTGLTVSGAVEEYYQKVTSVTPGKTYLLVANNYAMAHPSGSGTIGGTQISIKENTITRNSATQSLEFIIDKCTVDGFTDNYTIGFDLNGTQNYVYATAADKTTFNKSPNAVYNGKGTGVWVFSAPESITGLAGGSFIITNVEYSSSDRQILLNNTSFGFYKKNTSYYAIDLYELVD